MIETLENEDEINQQNRFQNIVPNEHNCENSFSQINFEKKESHLNYSQDQLSQPLAILNSVFYLIKKIGAGTSGAVYLSYSIEDPNRTLYAIKILPQTQSNSDFMNSCEVNYLSKITHKNILKVHYYGIGQIQMQNGSFHDFFLFLLDNSKNHRIFDEFLIKIFAVNLIKNSEF